MSAFLEDGRVLMRDGSVRQYTRAVLPVEALAGGHRGRLFFDRRANGSWKASSTSGCEVCDGCTWSPWAEVERLRQLGILTSHNHGPATYGHTDYLLAVSPVAKQECACCGTVTVCVPSIVDGVPVCDGCTVVDGAS